MKKETRILTAIVIIVLITIVGIFIVKDATRQDLTKAELLCLAGKSELYVSSTCGHCADQEKLLEDNLAKYDLDLSKFKIFVCDKEDTQKCIEKEISGVPTWFIDGQKYEGKKSLKELKQISEC